MEYVIVPKATASSSCSVKSPVIGSKSKPSALSGQTSQKHFGVGSPVTSPRKSYMDDPGFGLLDREASGSHRRSGSDRWAPPIFNFFKEKINSNG